MEPVKHKVLPLDVADEIEVYVPPEEMRLTSLRIYDEPDHETTAGIPFPGTNLLSNAVRALVNASSTFLLANFTRHDACLVHRFASHRALGPARSALSAWAVSTRAQVRLWRERNHAAWGQRRRQASAGENLVRS